MQTVHLKKSDDFAIFIENPGGSWFEISGQGRVALTPVRYVESAEAENKIQQLR